MSQIVTGFTNRNLSILFLALLIFLVSLSGVVSYQYIQIEQLQKNLRQTTEVVVSLLNHLASEENSHSGLKTNCLELVTFER